MFNDDCDIYICEINEDFLKFLSHNLVAFNNPCPWLSYKVE